MCYKCYKCYKCYNSPIGEFLKAPRIGIVAHVADVALLFNSI